MRPQGQPAFVVPKSVHITVSHLIPVSVNEYKCPYKRTLRDGTQVQKFVVTAEALAFKSAVAIFARGESIAPATDRERTKVRYELRVKVVLGKGQRGDGDNFWKCVGDALEEAGVIHSDARVRVWHMEVEDEDRENPRTEITASIWERPA